MNTLFPVFLKLEEITTLVIGGGNVAYEKIEAMTNSSPKAKATVIASEFKAELKELISRFPSYQFIEKEFEDNDLEGVQLVISAVNNKELSEQIKFKAKEKGILCNVADTPDLCDFYLGSIVQKGNLKIAISTNGKSPTMAIRLKELINEIIPMEINDSIEHIHAVRKNMKGTFHQKVKKLNHITKVLVENNNEKTARLYKKYATWSLIVFASMLLGHFIFTYLTYDNIGEGLAKIYGSLDGNFGWMLLAGFTAQLVDGALGMGYGLTSASILLSSGINPAAISGSIHTAEMFASGASGYSHYKFGNVNKKLFKVIVIPGVIGSISGAVLLVYLGDKYSDLAKTLVACYTFYLGIKFIINAFRKVDKKKFKHYGWLAGFGGFFDSFGGGGWGPIVTSTLVNKGRSHRFVVGTVSLTEFFVTLSSAFTFFILLGISHWQTILGLIIGGLLAAPIAAKLTGKIPRKTAFLLLGVLVVFWSLKILWILIA